MGVPFETLLPYGVIIGVRLLGQFESFCSQFTADVRRHWIWPPLSQALGQRWQAGALEPGLVG